MHGWKYLQYFSGSLYKEKYMFFFSSEPRQCTPEESYRLLGDAGLYYSEDEREELELKLKRGNIFNHLQNIQSNKKYCVVRSLYELY